MARTSWEDPPERGRPRRVGADEDILVASRELMFEGGYAGFSMDEVARRAGVGRQSVYRRWPSKSALVVAAMTWASESSDVFPDSGSIEGDLRAGLQAMRAMYDESSPHLFADVYFAMASDVVARELFNQHYVEPRRASLARAVARAIDREELRADTDVAIVGDFVSGPFMYRQLIGADEPREDLIEAIIGAVMALYGSKAPR